MAGPALVHPHVGVAAAVRILALDLSLTATGVCCPDGSLWVIRTGSRRAMERLAYVRDRIQHEVEVYEPDVVVLEGYSFASTGRAGISLGELGGAIRLALFCWGVPYVDIPPTNRARYAAGKGNASKDLVLQQAVFRSGRVFDDNNAADAWWLWQMALAHYEPESPLLAKVPKTHLDGLVKVPWVEIGKRTA